MTRDVTDTTLAQQFIRLLAPVMVVALAVALVAAAGINYSSALKEHGRRRDMLTATYLQSLSKPLWDCDDTAAQAIIDSMVQTTVFRGVRLKDTCTVSTLSSGATMAAGEGDDQRRLYWSDPQGRRFPVGEVDVQWRPFDFWQSSGPSLVAYLVVVSFAVICLAATMSFWFRRMVNEPFSFFRATIAHQGLCRDSQDCAPIVSSSIRNEVTRLMLVYDDLMATVARQKRELLLQARLDPLTGLGNRRKLAEAFAGASARAQRRGGTGFVLLLDLNSFKPVNDQYGHAAGDFVLETVARRLLSSVRADDTVIRHGGDEFVVLVEAMEPPVDIYHLMERLRGVIAEPMEYGDLTLKVTASMGYSPFSGGEDCEKLVAKADLAMYADKEARALGRG